MQAEKPIGVHGAAFVKIRGKQVTDSNPQALISGTFTLVNEAMKLKLWPMTHVRYPSQLRGQIYIPSINWILMAGCIAVVLIFQESAAMESALTVIRENSCIRGKIRGKKSHRFNPNR